MSREAFTFTPQFPTFLKVEKLIIDQSGLQQPKISFGIHSVLDFYRLAYFVGKALGVELKTASFERVNEHFNMEFYTTTLDEINLHLVKNQTPEGLFYPKAKLADYIIIISGENVSDIIGNLKKYLINQGIVQSIFAIELKFTPLTKIKYFA